MAKLGGSWLHGPSARILLRVGIGHLLKRCGLQDSVHYAPALHHGELMMLPNHRVPEMIDVLIQ